jgi:glycosyltransferase A (GT-A) superfamily protein (DUF2064 family)
MNRAYKSVSLCSISRREPVDRVVIVGTDSPSLPIDYVRMAFRALEESAVVIGPVRDGGYYLIGFSRDCPEAFKDINWGSSRVMRETLSRLGSQAYKALPEWYDIDVEQDIYLLWDDLESLFEGYPKRTRAFLCAQNIDTGNRF